MPSSIQPIPLLLASTSPRRAQILREAGYRFDIAAPRIEEPSERRTLVRAETHVESLAWFKARSVAEHHPNATILAADTVAYIGNEIIGKPADRADARRILNRLSNTDHAVITGVALFQPTVGRRMLRHDITTIRVRRLGRQAIEAYLDTGQWRGKAGAYGIQDHGDKFVERIEGSFTNVVGIPMELLARMFQEWERGGQA